MPSVKFAVNAVFCISLEEKEDRRALLKQSFRYLGHEITFVLVQRDALDPERGCYQSHLHCARLALQKNHRRVLILEDDATFLPPSPMQLKWINRFLKWRSPQLFLFGRHFRPDVAYPFSLCGALSYDRVTRLRFVTPCLPAAYPNPVSGYPD